MNKYTIIFLLPILLSACAGGEGDKKIQSADELLKADKITNSKIYHNPVSADKPVSPDEAAKLSFDEVAFDFGKVKEGEVVEHLFKFKNSGKAPLVITNATSTCGCTVPLWPKEPIPPGQTGEIKVSFNSKGKNGLEEKEIYIFNKIHNAL